MDDSWKSARFTKTLPALAVPPELHDKTKAYATDHDMKVSEVMRKALAFYFASEFTNSIQESSIGKSSQGSRSKKAKSQ